LAKLWRLVVEQKLQYTVFLILSGIVIILTVVTYLSNPSLFQRFFGMFSFLLNDGQFVVYRQGNLNGLLLAIGLAVPFAAVMILVDRRAPFPADINVSFPYSLTFYPAIGYVVEILFHVLPFCLLYFILGALVGESSSIRLTWLIILIVVLIEPVFQVSLTAGQNSNGVIAYLGLHLFLINLVQLLLFRRYDFITMYSFRLSYYALWHILWGHLRLSLLF
jgi:hypothetical protein